MEPNRDTNLDDGIMCDGCEEIKPTEPTPDGRALLCAECMAETRRSNPEWIGPE